MLNPNNLFTPRVTLSTLNRSILKKTRQSSVSSRRRIERDKKMQTSIPFSHGSTSHKFETNANAKFSIDQERNTRLQLLVTFLAEPCRPLSPSCYHRTLKAQHRLQPSLLLQSSRISWIRPSDLIPGSRIAPSVAPLQCGNSSNSFDAKTDNNSRSLSGWIELAGEAISTAFPICVTLGGLLGLLKPSSFNWVKPRWPVFLLSTTMLGMGMTLTLDDLNDAVSMPKEVLSGFLLQYSIMPISGFLVSKLLNLPSHFAAGLILLGCCPGGTASNIVTYIARGNVALSVVMTAASTFTAVAMTPFLTAKLAGQYVAVDANVLFTSTLQVVLLPVLAGAFLNQYFHGLVKFFSPLMPPIAVASVTVLCGHAIAQNSSAILSSGLQVVLAACLLHASGFFFGYVLSRMLRLDVASSRTVSIEVGMQNSVLGLVLATQHFGNPLTAVPCAVSSVCQSIIGSILAGIWRQNMPPRKQD